MAPAPAILLELLLSAVTTVVTAASEPPACVVELAAASVDIAASSWGSAMRPAWIAVSKTEAGTAASAVAGRELAAVAALSVAGLVATWAASAIRD
jgi:hypothetical protein